MDDADATPVTSPKFVRWALACDELATKLDRARTMQSIALANQTRKLGEVFCSWTKHEPTEEDEDIAIRTYLDLQSASLDYIGGLPRKDG